MGSVRTSPARRLRASHRHWLMILCAGFLVLTTSGAPPEQISTAVTRLNSEFSTSSFGVVAHSMGVIPLPINQGFSGGLAFGITQKGAGPSGRFRIDNQSSAASALEVLTNAGAVEATTALLARTTGRTRAGHFIVTSKTNPRPALEATTAGSGSAAEFHKNGPMGHGAALTVRNMGQGFAGFFESENGTSVHAESDHGIAGSFASSAGKQVLEVMAGNPPGGVFNDNALEVTVEDGATGWAALFTGSSQGVMIMTNPGGTGLQVVNGSKSAIVPTTSGAKALYSEEATEVWFSDYGFGKLVNGRARVLIDPAFAETVSQEQAYHVFVQPYGPAELYVEERTNLGFVVKLKDGDPNVDFGYRVVAKRLGFERERLERAPWADNRARF